MYTKYKYKHHTLIQVCILNINTKHHTLIQVCILNINTRICVQF